MYTIPQVRLEYKLVAILNTRKDRKAVIINDAKLTIVQICLENDRHRCLSRIIQHNKRHMHRTSRTSHKFLNICGFEHRQSIAFQLLLHSLFHYPVYKQHEGRRRISTKFTRAFIGQVIPSCDRKTTLSTTTSRTAACSTAESTLSLSGISLAPR